MKVLEREIASQHDYGLKPKGNILNNCSKNRDTSNLLWNAFNDSIHNHNFRLQEN